MSALTWDVKQAVRTFRRAPALTISAICILALGIGLATAVFTVADAVLLRRLPVVDQNRIVVLSGEAPRKGLDNVPLDVTGAREFARQTRTLSRVAFFLYNGAGPVTVREGASISRLQRSLVTGEYFDVLGARPLRGRTLRAEDDAAGAPPVLVLSHRAWQERFGGTADVIGRRIITHEDGKSYTIVGVMPAGLDYPRGTEAWVPLRAAIPPTGLQYASLDAIGRLANGVSAADARSELTAFFHRAGADAFFADVRGVSRTLPQLVSGDVKPAIVAFAIAAFLLLLITCVNVANLLLVRGLSRLREIAIRLALGASRGRVFGQLLTEHGLLALAGGVVSVVVAVALVRTFVAVAPSGTPRLDEITVNAGLLASALAITTVAILLSSVAPAVIASRVDIERVLRSDARQSASRASRLLTETLVAGQIALAVLVLSASALLARSFLRLQHADLGFEPARAIVAELAIQGDRYDTGPKQNALVERVLASLQAAPGFEAVSPVVSVPYGGERSWEGRPSAEGQTERDAAHNPMLDIEVVAPQFFTALGLPVTRGRTFNDADKRGAPLVVMLSESAARFYWPNANPIGKRLIVGPVSAPTAFSTVIGVVPDTRYRDLREPHANIYFPLAQSDFPFAPTTFVIRTARAPADAASALRNVLTEVAPDVALAKVVSFGELLDGPLAQPRMNTFLLALFAASAIVLASVGLFGVLATMVRQRRRELGIRMTLGASPNGVAWLVVRRGLVVASIGTAAGLLGALGTNRLLQSLLFEVSPADAWSLAAVAAIIVVVAIVASAVPARSSARIDPAIALRAE